jgi:hypothetical protein
MYCTLNLLYLCNGLVQLPFWDLSIIDYGDVKMKNEKLVGNTEFGQPAQM